MPRTRRTTIASALVAVGALATFTALGIVLAPGAPSVDTHALAAHALNVARQAEPASIADAVARELPTGGRAVVVRPARANEPSSRSGTSQVAVLVGEVDQAAVSLLVSTTGVVGAHATPDGWWTSIAVPALVPPPVGAALALLIGAVLLGAAATEVPRRRAPPIPTRQKDVLVRGLSDLMPKLPEGVAWQAENLLTAAGIRLVVPDGEPVDPRGHLVIGTEPTEDDDLVDTVARTVRPGYADGSRIVVHPSVVMYVRD